jgi:D-alanyl-D-alanine carboxypeptidase (penicillin-binding protein 5/6)
VKRRRHEGWGSGRGVLGSQPSNPFLAPRPSSSASRRGPAGVGARWWLAAMLAVLLALVLLLGLMPGAAAGPSSTLAPAVPRQVHVKATIRPPSYGWTLAPRSQRVSVKLKLPLTSGLLFNVRTGAILWERQPDRVLPIASLTKMMTALLVLARARPSDGVRITPQAVHFTGSGVGLLPLGKRVSLLSLLYGLLLPSGNDAAIALAQHVAGTQSRFVALMNQQAHQWGLRCTQFASVSGIVDRHNHSCPGDLAFIAHRVLEQPLLARIVGSRSAVLPFPIKAHKLYLYNNNPLLVEGYPGADGVKTGYTNAAGVCLVATARRGRSWFGVVLLHSANIAVQAQALLNAAFAKRGSS